MPKHGKQYSDAATRYDRTATYAPRDALELIKSLAYGKFDESVDVVFQLGIDPRKADQIVRGTTSLPHGTGKDVRICAIVGADKVAEAQEAGAAIVGSKELAEEIAGGRELDWDITIASPDMMSEVGKLGRVLGPRGLMPNPKAGTVTQDVGKAVTEFKAGRVEYRNDRYGNVHLTIGKVSFDVDRLEANLAAVADELFRAKPAASKGRYVKKAAVSSTMGPGVRLDPAQLEDLAATVE
jgi:large subunit ribosomal protein L1